MDTTQSILKELNRWLLSQLIERRSVSLPHIGEISTQLSSAYVKVNEGVQMLYPPTVSLRFVPANYLLDDRHYSALDVNTPTPMIGEDVAYALSDMLNISRESVIQTINDEFHALLKGLFRGKRVSLLEIGDLFVTDEGDELLFLNFEPNPSIQEYLNRPFAPYAPAPLKIGVDFHDLPHYGSGEEAPDPTVAQKYRVMHIELPQEPEQEVEVEVINIAPVEEQPSIVEVKEAELGETIPTSSRRRSNIWLWSVPAALIILVAVLYLSQRTVTTTAPTESTQVMSTDSSANVQQLKDTVPVSDEKPPIDTLTISSGRSLYSYAKDYYGQKMFWVYIYIENAKGIDDPNRISLGTKLVIPNLDKFDINPDMRIAVKEARIWESVIMSKKFTTYEETRPLVLERLAKQQ
ncbi:hypothetical protein [Porphyromonas sp.]|uniref:hypothetical protein n=1 Tax=Porphyromonas sp. TaxID=1924944 RepID=UPI0026DDC5AE|nr:hypothetical protein [Porphyromonas sp.]MDO4770302.1 hypothetical protein [Porphyromonas sp.]